jgi:membrane-associated protease RseP (regulator of RpoE activity)
VTKLLYRNDDRPTGPLPPPQKAEQRAALYRLLAFIAAAALAAVVTQTYRTVLVIVALIVMIMLHEFGHFVMAKRAKMKVTEFFVGFGPRLWSTRRGETEYGVKALVAGGYVRIIGMSNLEDVAPEDEPRTYRQATFGSRLSTICAGSVMHFIIAFVLLIGINAFVGVVHSEPVGARVHSVSAFKTGPSPAQLAGLKPGDRILTADGKRLSADDLTSYIRERPSRPIVLDVLRGTNRITLTVTPVDLATVQLKAKSLAPTDVKPSDHVGFVGVEVAAPSHIEKTSNPVIAVARAGRDVGDITWLSMRGLADIVSFHGIHSYSDQITGHTPTHATQDQPRFLSPVGFVRVASEAADVGLRPVLYLLVAINIFVGIFNMLPLPPFDGGHAAVAIYEWARSRRGRRYQVDMAKLLPITYGVVMLLMFVAVASLYLDIVHPLSLQ